MSFLSHLKTERKKETSCDQSWFISFPPLSPKQCLKFYNELYCRTSLVLQWWRIHLPMQGTQAASQVCCVCSVTSAMSNSLYDPMDCSLPGFSVHGILQTRTLEWVAKPSCRVSSWPRDWTHVVFVSCIAGRVSTAEWAWEDIKCQNAKRQWSPSSTATEAMCPNYWSPRACFLPPREATTMSSPWKTMKSSPCSLQLEKARTQQWRPSVVKKKKKPLMSLKINA